MGGGVAGRAGARPLAVAAMAGMVALAALAVPADGAAQEGRPVLPTDAAADTLPPDSLLTQRERALRRLRAMPVSPLDPLEDTVPADTAGEIVVAADTPVAAVPADSAAVVDPARVAPPDRAVTAADTGAVAGRPVRPPPDVAPPDVAPPVRPRADTLGPDRPARPDEAGVAQEPEAGRVLREDSVLAALRSLEGYVVTEYRGESAVFEAEDNRLRLTGESRVAREGSALETDSVLVFAGDRGVVCGYGNPVLSGDADPVESDRVCFDINRNVGEAVGARTRFVQGATWFVRGAENRVYLLTGEEQNRLYGSKAEFTSCDLPEPHYVFRARSLKMVEGDLMVARNITLEFEDVPVFWLPWMVQSMKRGRRSGLLMPEFGVNDIVRNQTGYNRHISNLGFYWAINDYLGARGTFEWYSNNYTAVETALAYHWRRQFLRGSWTARQYWRDGGRRDLTINTSNSWEPDERTSLQLSGSYATSSEFVRDFSFDPRELNRRISSSGSISRSFDWGSVNLGAQRNQDIITDKVDLTLPSLQLSLQPITLYASETGMLDLTWSGSGTASRRTVEVAETLYPTVRDEDDVNASANHSLSFGRLSLSQSIDYDNEWQGPKRPVGDEPDVVGTPPGEVLLPESRESLRWSTSLGYQQDLWAGTTLTPSLSISGNQLRSDQTGDAFLAEPTRLSASAGLSTTIFGFWPGIARFERIRHKISPSLSWNFSPTATATEAQERVFGIANLREQNRLTLRFNQTFEAKVRAPDTATVGVDDAPVDDAVVDDAGPGAEAPAPGEPRRLPQAEKVMLLSISTSGPFVYDFVAAREDGRGFLTDQVSNSLRSDLLQDLTVDFSHDLFEEGEPATPGGTPPRSFSPFLTRLNASFRIDQDFWLFRLLGLTAPVEDETPQPPQQGVAESEDPTQAGEMDVEQVPGRGGIVPGRGGQEDGLRHGVGGWQASLNYSLNRFRAAEGAAQREADQTVSGNMSFKPTEHWSLRWSTSYSFTAGEFNSHVLTLTRDLHRWQANFDFIKAQNGNFLFTFRVQLTDNPDLKLDYDQSTDPSERRRQEIEGTQ